MCVRASLCMCSVTVGVTVCDEGDVDVEGRTHTHRVVVAEMRCANNFTESCLATLLSRRNSFNPGDI